MREPINFLRHLRLACGLAISSPLIVGPASFAQCDKIYHSIARDFSNPETRIGSIFVSLHPSDFLDARSLDTCVKYQTRAPLKSVCGRVINPLGERPEGVELALEGDNGSVLFAAKADNRGTFAFGPVPKGDYTLRASAPGYTTERRQVRVTRDKDKHCGATIHIKLGLKACDGGTYVMGFDKERDLIKEE